MEPSIAKGLQRGLRLLELLSASRDGLAFSDIAVALRLNNNSCARLLHGLQTLDYIRHDGERYRCGPALDRLAPPAGDSERLRRVVEPLLERLSAHAACSSTCLVWDGDAMLVVATRLHPDSLTMRQAGHRGVNVRQNPWGWIFMGAGFWRRATAANHPERSQSGGPTVPLKLIRGELTRLRREGWCEHRRHDRHRLAAVVGEVAQPLAVIGLAGTSHDFADGRRKAAITHLLDAVHRATRLLQ